MGLYSDNITGSEMIPLLELQRMMVDFYVASPETSQEAKRAAVAQLVTAGRRLGYVSIDRVWHSIVLLSDEKRALVESGQFEM